MLYGVGVRRSPHDSWNIHKEEVTFKFFSAVTHLELWSFEFGASDSPYSTILINLSATVTYDAPDENIVLSGS